MGNFCDKKTTEMNHKYEVVVVGGGTAGAFLGGKLAARGIKTAILEKKKQPSGKPCCTGLISVECAKRFNLPNEAIIRKVNGARVFSPGGKLINLYREEPQALVIDRTVLELSMIEQASKYGAKYFGGHYVVDFNTANGKADVLVNNGKQVHFEADLMVLANGFNGGFAPLIKLHHLDYAFGSQVIAETEAEEVEVYLNPHFAHGFFGWIVPTNSSEARVGLLCRKNPEANLRKYLKFLVDKKKVMNVSEEINTGIVPLAPISPSYGERVLLVGDSAGQVKPISGGGIYFGLLGAEVAANTIVHALETNDFSEKCLAGYEAGWKKIIGRELEVGSKIRKIYEQLPGRLIDLSFDYVNKSNIVNNILNDRSFKFDWHSEPLIRLFKELTLYNIFNSFSLD